MGAHLLLRSPLEKQAVAVVLSGYHVRRLCRWAAWAAAKCCWLGLMHRDGYGIPRRAGVRGGGCSFFGSARRRGVPGGEELQLLLLGAGEGEGC